MERLLELLNEYRTEKLRREMYVNWADKEAIELSEAERINEYEVSQTLDSLNYLRLFIKWLVENNKVDFELDRIILKHKWIDFNTWKWIAVEKLCDKYESLLMLLSISDTPIDFLCEIIKN